MIADTVGIEKGTEGYKVCWTDRVPMRVIGVRRNAAGEVREVFAKSVSVQYDENGYEVPGSRGETPEVGPYEVFTLRRNGSFTERGSEMGNGWRFGVGEHGYYDRSF